MTTYANRLVTTVSAVGAAGAGDFTISTASSGYRTFVAGDDAKYFDVSIVEGTAWEVRTGCLYTHSGPTLARGTLEASSTGSAIAFTAAAILTVTPTAAMFNALERTMASLTPGGRLTLETGVPASSSDQTAKTTIYYTPYVHNVISLWDGVDWVPTTFTEHSLALGTLTDAKQYDVFAYLNSGALAAEVLVWTNDTTRATAVTLQDGRYCKSGDKTRLLLGTFRTTSSTTTEDSAQKRYVCNVYNQVARRMFYSTTGETTTSASPSEIDNNGSDTFPRLGVVATLLTSAPFAFTTAASSGSPSGDLARVVLYQNGTSGTGLATYDLICQTTSMRVVGAGNPALTPGYHYLSVWGSRQSGANTVTIGTSQMWGSYSC